MDFQSVVSVRESSETRHSRNSSGCCVVEPAKRAIPFVFGPVTMKNEILSIYRWLEDRSLRLASIAGVLLALLIVLWLSITTRTAMYYADIERLEAERLMQIDRINGYWKKLGELSAPQVLLPRAQALGFRKAPVEYILIETATVTAGRTVTP